jgi:hypothetical protein
MGARVDVVAPVMLILVLAAVIAVVGIRVVCLLRET